MSRLRFASLGSGSRGNATLVAVNGSCVMVDCGFSVVEVERRMARLAMSPGDLSGILVTHEHSDHINGVAALARRYDLPVWLSAGTRAAHRQADIPNARTLRGDAAFAIDAIEVTPFTVPHDAREPCQFVFSDGAHRLGVLTDIGSLTPHVCAMLDGCDALLLECNHDSEMLANGPYPPRLKARVGGRLGHLSNDQSAELLARIDCSRLQHVAAAHLSDKNNTPARAVAALAEALDCTHDWIGVATQDDGLAWREIT